MSSDVSSRLTFSTTKRKGNSSFGYSFCKSKLARILARGILFLSHTVLKLLLNIDVTPGNSRLIGWLITDWILNQRIPVINAS